MNCGYILVTGAAGFVGQALGRALCERLFDVRMLLHAGSPRGRRAASALAAEEAWGDLLDRRSLRAALRDVTCVVNLAGRRLEAGVPAEEHDELHIGGTANLLAACREAGTVPCIVHCSMARVAGPADCVPLAEDGPVSPEDCYEHSKAMGEKQALTAVRVQALPVCVVRPTFVYGPGCSTMLGCLGAIQRGTFRLIGGDENLIQPSTWTMWWTALWAAWTTPPR